MHTDTPTPVILLYTEITSVLFWDPAAVVFLPFRVWMPTSPPFCIFHTCAKIGKAAGRGWKAENQEEPPLSPANMELCPTTQEPAAPALTLVPSGLSKIELWSYPHLSYEYLLDEEVGRVRVPDFSTT